MSEEPHGRKIVAGLAAVAAAVLSACGAPEAGTGANAPVSPGTAVFRDARPGEADCSLVDLTQLGSLSAVTVPEGKAELKQVDARPDHVWASCVGRSPVVQSSDGSVTGGQVVWLVSFATSSAASSDSERMSTDTAPGFRTLVRPARLGDARAQVVMDVHVDDHETLLVVTVFDPRTGRPAARCGLAAARGDRADDAANWCLHAVSDQLMRPPSPVPVLTDPTPGVTDPTPGVTDPTAGVTGPTAGVTGPTAGVTGPTPGVASGTAGPSSSSATPTPPGGSA